METKTLLDAIRVVKENEKTASEFYGSAAKETGNPMGRQLFEQLKAFENYHYIILTSLEKTLQANNEFIYYEGRDFPLPPAIAPKAADEPNQQTVINIISQAIELEKQAEKAYADIAAQVSDPQGHAMFKRLSEEERNHQRILSKVYWSLTNLKAWEWPQPA